MPGYALGADRVEQHARQDTPDDCCVDPFLPPFAIVGGFAALLWGADRFVLGAAAMAHNLGISPLIVGLTIVGFGTSAPELLVSAIAAHRDATDLSIGNALGSNITNIALVLGLTALVAPLPVSREVIDRQLPVLLAAMLGASALLADGQLGFGDGALLLLSLAITAGWVVWRGVVEHHASDTDGSVTGTLSTPKALAWVAVGLFILLSSSEILVWGAKSVAVNLGVSERVIGLSVVAFGTSLPELVATLVAARRREHDIAVGNIVGSNMFNLLGVLGLPGIIAPGPCKTSFLRFDAPVMIGLTVLLWILARCLRPRHRLSRGQGALLAACYVGYVGALALGVR